MSKADVLSMAQGWLLGVGDAAYLDGAYAEVVQRLARHTGMFVEDKVLHVGEAVHTYLIDARAITPRAIAIFPEGEIEAEQVSYLDQYDPIWRTRTGPPTHYLQDLDDARVVRLVPTPDADGITGLWIFGSGMAFDPGPFDPDAFDTEADNMRGEMYAVYTVIPIDEDVPEWLDFRLSVELAAMDASRQGEAEDKPYADALAKLVELYDDLLKGFEEF